MDFPYWSRFRMRVIGRCVSHIQQSDHTSLAVLWMSTQFAILSSLIRVYTICHSQPSDQGLHCHSEQSDQDLHYLPFAVVGSSSSSTVIIRNSLIKVNTIFHSQRSDNGLHYFPFFLSSIIKVYTVCHSFLAVLSRSTLFAFSAVWSWSTLFVILSSPIRVYTVSHSQQSDKGQHCLPFTVWSGSTLFAIHSLIRVYTICHSQQAD